MPTLTPVTLSSENPKYNHTITVAVDNDLTSASTIIVPGTFFPYIVEFTGYPPTQGKRYISEWLYDKLISEYKTSLGRVLFSLKKDISAIPYYTLDYNLFRDKVTSLQNEKIEVLLESGPALVNDLNYVGSAIGSFDDITPEYLLKWLDFPIKDGDGEPVEKFPILLDYKSSPVSNVELVVIGHISVDFYQPEYLVIIEHNVLSPIIFYSNLSYNQILSQYNFATGEYSRPVTYLKIQNASLQQNLDRMLTTALNPNLKSLLPNTNLSATAKGVIDKFNQLKALAKTPLPKLPKIPRVNLSKFIVDLRVKFTAKKNIKRVKKSESFNFSLAEKPKLPSSLSSGAAKLKTAGNLANAYKNKLTSTQNQLAAISTKLNSITIL